MRKITQLAITAFQNGTPFKKGNTEVWIDDKGVKRLLLHDNCIAKIDANGLAICPCGYMTRTTKERLNGLPGVQIIQKDYVWYLHGKKLDMRNWTYINK